MQASSGEQDAFFEATPSIMAHEIRLVTFGGPFFLPANQKFLLKATNAKAAGLLRRLSARDVFNRQPPRRPRMRRSAHHSIPDRDLKG